LNKWWQKLKESDSQTDTPPDVSIGATLRTLRKSRGLTLADLSLVVGRSQGWVSQVERNISEISISDLRRIADAFEVPVGLFFHNEDAPDDERGRVVRARARHALGNQTDGLIEELLSPDLGGSFEMVRSIFEAGAELPEPQKRQTEEAGYIISGVLDIWMDEQLFRLEAGDSFRLNGERYRWRNPGSDAAVVIWVISPPVY
jgi:transcriptional regulator with XRE-family HTH domain